MTPRRRPHCHVYVVKYADQVWKEVRIRRRNPDHQLCKPLVYGGMTGLAPYLRFDRRKAGLQTNRYVLQHPLPHLFAVHSPHALRTVACEMEVELDIALREAGCEVWQC